MTTTINTIKQVRDYFQNQEDAYYFVSASNFNLMSIHTWVKIWFNVNLIDCYDGQNPSILLPKYKTMPLFDDIEKINAFLLGNKAIVEHIQKQQKNAKTHAMFLFYNSALEEIAISLDVNKIMPENSLVKEIDNKITTTQIGNKAGVLSVPNALVKIDNYQTLQKIQEKHNLSDSVVVQTEYGDSGKTTFFIENEAEYNQVAEKIEVEDKVKVMKKIDCTQIAIEAVATKQGTFVGPILTEIIGESQLTPYKGGWCGNDIGVTQFSTAVQDIIYRNTQALGEALYQRGYHGYFELDYLLDNDNGEVYLGEINPRVTGISALTNMSAFCQQSIPLYLLHLLEYSDAKIALDVQDFNQKSQNFDHPAFGQLIFKYLEESLQIITQTLKTGVYKIKDNALEFVRYADDATDLATGECYILQILKVKEYAYKGADLLVLFVGDGLKGANGSLSNNAQTYIDLVHSYIQYRVLTGEEKQLTQRYGKYAALKVSEDSE